MTTVPDEWNPDAELDQTLQVSGRAAEVALEGWSADTQREVRRMEQSLMRDTAALRQQMQRLDGKPRRASDGFHSDGSSSDQADNISLSGIHGGSFSLSTCTSNGGSIETSPTRADTNASDAVNMELRRSVQRMCSTLARVEVSQKTEMDALWAAVREIRSHKTIDGQSAEKSDVSLRDEVRRIAGHVEQLEQNSAASRQVASLVTRLGDEFAELRRHTEELSRKQKELSQALRNSTSKDGSGEARLEVLAKEVDALREDVRTTTNMSSVHMRPANLAQSRLEELERAVEHERQARADEMEHVRNLVDKVAVLTAKCPPAAPTRMEGPALHVALEKKLNQQTDSKCAQMRGELLEELRSWVAPMAKDISRVEKVEQDVRMNSAALGQLDEVLHMAHKSMDRVMEKMALEANSWQATQDRVEILAKQVEESLFAGATEKAVATDARGRRRAETREGAATSAPSPGLHAFHNGSRSSSPQKRGETSAPLSGTTQGDGGRMPPSPIGPKQSLIDHRNDRMAASCPGLHAQDPKAIACRPVGGSTLKSSLERLNQVLDVTLRRSQTPPRTTPVGQGATADQVDLNGTLPRNADPLGNALTGLSSTVSRTLQQTHAEADQHAADSWSVPATSPVPRRQSPVGHGASKAEVILHPASARPQSSASTTVPSAAPSRAHSPVSSRTSSSAPRRMSSVVFGPGPGQSPIATGSRTPPPSVFARVPSRQH